MAKARGLAEKVFYFTGKVARRRNFDRKKLENIFFKGKVATGFFFYRKVARFLLCKK